MPAAPTLVSGDASATTALLEIGETWAYTAAYTVTQADLNAGGATWCNVATVDTDQTGPDTDDATCTVAQSPALKIVKELTDADDAVVDTAGETIKYTITVDNTGNDDLTGVVVTDRVCRRRDAGQRRRSATTTHARDRRDLDLQRRPTR